MEHSRIMSEINLRERICINKDQLNEIENQVLLQHHIQRYSFARQYVSGRVLDISCGCGYGTYMLQTNPDVSNVVGVDCDVDSIVFAKSNYSTSKTNYILSSVEKFSYPSAFDWVVCMETIEHLDHPEYIVKFCVKNGVKNVLISYPMKKTTHYNPYHKTDFDLDSARTLFYPRYRQYDNYEFFRATMCIFFERIN